ncbi:hypothetical protein A0H81_07357 [Grifola frondosa]|uniref:Uncharacterized protein n=1 Tax=Grifola frondosa TaxID=5627 RepID=A0A1C7M739_GRIFR|nr:hypothetical protein A0H81_07357 [Grifola frondosa]
MKGSRATHACISTSRSRIHKANTPATINRTTMNRVAALSQPHTFTPDAVANLSASTSAPRGATPRSSPYPVVSFTPLIEVHHGAGTKRKLEYEERDEPPKRSRLDEVMCSINNPPVIAVDHSAAAVEENTHYVSTEPSTTVDDQLEWIFPPITVYEEIRRRFPPPISPPPPLLLDAAISLVDIYNSENDPDTTYTLITTLNRSSLPDRSRSHNREPRLWKRTCRDRVDQIIEQYGFNELRHTEECLRRLRERDIGQPTYSSSNLSPAVPGDMWGRDPQSWSSDAVEPSDGWTPYNQQEPWAFGDLHPDHYAGYHNAADEMPSPIYPPTYPEASQRNTAGNFPERTAAPNTSHDVSDENFIKILLSVLGASSPVPTEDSMAVDADPVPEFLYFPPLFQNVSSEVCTEPARIARGTPRTPSDVGLLIPRKKTTKKKRAMVKCWNEQKKNIADELKEIGLWKKHLYVLSPFGEGKSVMNASRRKEFGYYFFPLDFTFTSDGAEQKVSSVSYGCLVCASTSLMIYTFAPCDVEDVLYMYWQFCVV